MSLFSQARERLRALFFTIREERELAEELSFHLDMETGANLQRGMSKEEARRQAFIRLGGVEHVKEEVREARSLGLLEDLVQDLRYALRRLARDPAFSVPVTVTLGLGIGVTAAVFGLANAVLIRPLPYLEADRLVALRHAAARAELPMTGVSPGLADYYRANSRVFEDIGVYSEQAGTLTDSDQPERVYWTLATPEFFSVLRVGMSVGRLPQRATSDPGGFERGVVISHALWTRRYGADSGLVSRTIELDRVKRTVLGVAEPGFHFPHAETDVWEAWGWPPEVASRAGLRWLAFGGIARLKSGVAIEEAQRDLDRLVQTLPDAFPDVTAPQLAEMGFRAAPVPLNREIIGSVREAVLLLLAAGAFLLLITWANSTNLTLVRAERMRREVAIARALGAGGGHLARRFLGEGLVLGALGGVLGIGLSAVAIELRFGFAPNDIPRLRELGVDGEVVGLAIGLAVVSSVLLALVAFVSGARPQLASTLAGALGRVTAGQREQTGRRLLVAGQVALALTLLIAAALMAQSFWRLKQVRLGFEPEDGLAVRLEMAAAREGPNHYHNMARINYEILRRIRALPGVEAAEAASTSGFPLTPVPSYYNFRITPAERVDPYNSWPYGLLSFATPGYFRAMGIPILNGRSFRYEDTDRERHGVILSASLAQTLFGIENPVGRRVRYGRGVMGVRSTDPEFVVVGVAGDVPSGAIQDGPSKVFYFPNLYPPKADTITGVVHIFIPDDVFFLVRTRLPVPAIVPDIQRRIREVDPKLVISRIGTLHRLVGDSMARARLTMLLLIVAAATALALGVIGIYGVLAYAVSRRVSELGVRIALGASPGTVARMVVRQGAALAALGIVVGVLAALGLSRYLRVLLYEVSPTDPAVFAAMAALLFAVALGASYVPARRATKVDPVQALRTE